MRHWDLAAGMGTAFRSALKAGLSYKDGYYTMCEINETAAGVLRANLNELVLEYPDTAPPADRLADIQGILPDDLFELARTVRDVLVGMPDEMLPNFVTASVPCTESSKAGVGGAGRTEKGKLYWCVMTVIHAISDEYLRRGLSTPGQSRVGWLYETSPTDDSRAAISDFRSHLVTLMGEPALPDEARAGGTSRRRTEIYTNLGPEETWSGLPGRLRKDPVVPLASLLRRGEYVQTWDSVFHGPAELPNVDGEPLKVWPKVVRSLGSHAWRADPIWRRVGDAWESKYPIGVSFMEIADEGLVAMNPAPEQLERGFGLPAGYTSAAVLQDGTVTYLADEYRQGLLGDMFGMYVHSAALRDRMGRRVQFLLPDQSVVAGPAAEGSAD